MTNGKSISAIDNPGMLPAGHADLQNATTGISADASLNFSIAKVVAIFTVVAGHWFTGTILWIPVTFGLFVFAFSSAYFTSKIYGVQIDRNRFWKKKLERLGLRFWVILSILSVILVFQGKTVFHWHTLIHFAGLSGVLNWFSLPNQSTLGAGLWFFSLLLMFYLGYPYLAKLGRTRSAALGSAFAAIAIAVFLRETIQVGHELWLTSLGFILGVMYGLHEPRFHSRIVFFLAGLSCVGLLGVNLLSHYKQFNTILITSTSICLSLWLSKAALPNWRVMKALAKLEKYLLEIFIMHTYLFVHVSGNAVPDFFASVLLIVIVAMAVNHIVTWLSSQAFQRGGA